MTKKATSAKTENQSVVYKVPAAFALMILVVYGFWRLGAYYATLAGFEALYAPIGTAQYISLALLAVCIVLPFAVKKPLVRTLCCYGAAAFALLAVSCRILHVYWTGNMIVIYLLHALVYCLYMVWQLYRAEFFTFSLATAPAGVVFYLIARTNYAANRIGGCVLLVLLLAAIALVTYLCAKNRGKLPVGDRLIRLFPASFNPLLVYFICGLWLVILATCMIFGAGFAFYAMFAAIAMELIGAVYYTFQLK